jgi:hypothetical protein
MVEDVADIAVEAFGTLGDIGAIADRSPRRRLRKGCGWLSLFGVAAIVIAGAAALLRG